MRIDELILYRGFHTEELLKNMEELLKGQASARLLYRALSYQVTGELLTLSNELGFEGNLWHAYLTWLLANHENSFSKACEIRGETEGTINEIALHDIAIFRELFRYDISELDERYDVSCFHFLKNYVPVNDTGSAFNKRIRDRICTLSVTLASAKDEEEMLKDLKRFYGEFGVGKFGLHKAFRLVEAGPDHVEIEPITKVAHVMLEDLVGYESAKKKLIENTEAFVAGRKANNCLLFGDAGTGKSSSIKGILNRYYDRGLRIIEIYRHQFRYLNDVIAQIKNRNYRFIIYMDDLSFEDSETEYKYLKAVIEGGLERKPENVLIYATSNRRHLVHENFRDKLDRYEDDDLHESDTVQEKLSLYNRFGVTIYFGRPDPKQFKTIVTTLAERNGIDMSEEELLLEANRWELNHGGLSGRTAQQYIDYCVSIGRCR